MTMDGGTVASSAAQAAGSRILSIALNVLGEAEPARDLGEDTLRRCRRVLGPDHRPPCGRPPSRRSLWSVWARPSRPAPWARTRCSAAAEPAAPTTPPR